MGRRSKPVIKGMREDLSLLTEAFDKADAFMSPDHVIHDYATDKKSKFGWQKTVTYFMGKCSYPNAVKEYSFTTTLKSHRGLMALVRKAKTTKGFSEEIQQFLMQPDIDMTVKRLGMRLFRDQVNFLEEINPDKWKPVFARMRSIMQERPIVEFHRIPQPEEKGFFSLGSHTHVISTGMGHGKTMVGYDLIFKDQIINMGDIVDIETNSVLTPKVLEDMNKLLEENERKATQHAMIGDWHLMSHRHIGSKGD